MPPQTTKFQAAPCQSPPQQHHQRQVDMGPSFAVATTSQRYIQVIAQPGRERDMPAPPEFGDRRRQIGRVEVLRQYEPEHETETDRHVGVAAEIEVDLKRVGGHAVPRIERGDRAGAKGHIGDAPAGVGQEHFLRQTEA